MRSPSRQAGATYLLMLFAVAALGLGLAGFGTVWSTAAQRDREAELLFIGGEFARALASYRAMSPAGAAAYPQRLEDLLLDPRQPFVRRHLRRLYRDPMTGEADWLVDRRDGQIVAVRSRSTRPALRRTGLPPWVAVQGEATRHTDWQMRPADEGLAPPLAAQVPGEVGGMDVPSFDQYDLERLKDTLEGAVRVRRPNEFYLWVQGALQRFLPHETLVCLHGGATVGQEGGVEIFSRAVLSPALEAALRAPADQAWVRLRGLWQQQGRRPCAHSAPDTQAACAGLGLPAGSMLVHGVDESAVPAPCLFIFLGMPGLPGPREHYLAELLLPHLYLAFFRQRPGTQPEVMPAGLTPRQRQVLEGVRSGKTNAQIAVDLQLSPLTVKHHVQQALRKLSVNNRAEAAAVTSAPGWGQALNVLRPARSEAGIGQGRQILKLSNGRWRGLAFVDIETNGGVATVDGITEVGIVEVDEDGVREWSQLIRPEGRIPEFIQRLTGISNEMVADAPRFAEVAEEIYNRLDGRLFIAHNARFDYGFLRNAFERVGLPLRPPVLCTVKLSRALFPEHRRHGLDALIERHGLVVGDRHRALADAQLVWQFWQLIHRQLDSELIDTTIARLLGRPALPPHLDPSIIDELPETPGVYLFFGENDLPLYVGKSKDIRTRVLSHFSADHSSAKEMSLSQQLRRIEWIETAGEVGALLLEAKLVKERQPIHNRRLRRSSGLCAWQLVADGEGGWRPVLVRGPDLDPGRQDNLFGFFTSQTAATKALRTLADEHALCQACLGLEKVRSGQPCFGYQIKRCKGACIGAESRGLHGARLMMALQKLRVERWPYAGPVGLREGEALHVIDNWCWLGTARSEDEVHALLESGRPAFDLDVWKILTKALAKGRVVKLGAAGAVGG